MIAKSLNAPSGDVRKNFMAFGLLTFVWLLIVFLVNPVGDFPLNEDWAYAKTVQSLLRGNLQLTDWAPASQVAQIAWGALFCLPFGFSFTALRLSTLVLGWVGVLHKGLAEGRFTTKNMDGGFEFGGWYSYDSKYKALPGKSWWWVDRDDFAVAFGPIEGYQIYERHPFDRWMPIGVKEVLILKRNNS